MTKRQKAALCISTSTVNPLPNVSLMTFRGSGNQRTHMGRYSFLTSCLCWSSLILLADGSSASGGLEGATGVSPFVSAAPLIVAAVCRDGVAVVAAHTSTEDEPLLYHSTLQDSDVENKDSDSDSDVHSVEVGGKDVQDLPLDYGGPFRIHTIDSFGTTLVSAGWRSDCEVLANSCRSIAASQLARMGPPDTAGSSLYGHFLATELSLYMSTCSISERVRNWILYCICICGIHCFASLSLLAHCSVLLLSFLH
jgi:hypothetical protein